MPRCCLPPIVLLAFACLTLPAAADPAAPPPRPSNLRSDILYTHRGEFVQVKPMRALTLNAHVTQFAYDPLGLEIAIIGSETSGGQTAHFVKTLDAHTGHEISRYAVTAPADDKNTQIGLLGFSTSGKYLLLMQFIPDPNDPADFRRECLRWDLSSGSPPSHVINPQSALPPDEQSPDLTGSADGYPSPDGRWLLFTPSFHTQTPDGKPGPDRNAFVLYDPERDTFRLLTLPPHASSYSWSDTTHLKVWQGGERKQFDVVTEQISPLTTPLDYAPPAVSKQYPDLSLKVEQQAVEEKTAKGVGGQVDANIVWIKRSPFGTLPLGVAAAGLMPAQYCDSPPAWSPTGRQIAFVASDDLHVTDLFAPTDPMPNEKLAVGQKLSCAEEQELAASNLKQIGLGIIQYAQDNDEKFPTADGWIKTIYPYIKSMDVFGVDGHPFVYEKPAASLRDLDSPAVTENGYINLPCARVVLFCDGHVKVFAK